MLTRRSHPGRSFRFGAPTSVSGGAALVWVMAIPAASGVATQIVLGVACCASVFLWRYPRVLVSPEALEVRNYRRTKSFRLDNQHIEISLAGKRLKVTDDRDGDQISATAIWGKHQGHLDALWVTGQWRRFEEYLRDVAAAAGTRIHDD